MSILSDSIVHYYNTYKGKQNQDKEMHIVYKNMHKNMYIQLNIQKMLYGLILRELKKTHIMEMMDIYIQDLDMHNGQVLVHKHY